MNIRYLKHNEIDKERWDEVICKSYQFVPYALSWYLDIVCPEWEAIISDDYNVVMPLPLKRKLGVSYLVQPIWVQQLGIFSTREINQNEEVNFISFIPYKMYAFNLNECNIYDGNKRNLNLCLKLNKSYEAISKSFSKNTSRNIQKAKKEQLRVEKIDKDTFFSIWRDENRYLGVKYESKLAKLIDESIKRKCGELIAAKDDNGEVIAVLFYLIFPQRIIYLAPASNELGFKKSAMFLIVDSLVEQYAGNNCILDFEGSMLAGVARFYRGFGSEERYYQPISRFYPHKLLKLLHSIL